MKIINYFDFWLSFTFSKTVSVASGRCPKQWATWLLVEPNYGDVLLSNKTMGRKYPSPEAA